jgi:hypothetical protein
MVPLVIDLLQPTLLGYAASGRAASATTRVTAIVFAAIMSAQPILAPGLRPCRSCGHLLPHSYTHTLPCSSISTKIGHLCKSCAIPDGAQRRSLEQAPEHSPVPSLCVDEGHRIESEEFCFFMQCLFVGRFPSVVPGNHDPRTNLLDSGRSLVGAQHIQWNRFTCRRTQ